MMERLRTEPRRGRGSGSADAVTRQSVLPGFDDSVIITREHLLLGFGVRVALAGDLYETRPLLLKRNMGAFVCSS
jgi:hypothetical protein